MAVPLNAPNVLTIARICLVPVMILLLLDDRLGPLYAAAAVFGAAALTDVADGHLARSRNMITTFGRLVDPVADKLLVGAALATLVAIDRLALWIALIIVAREVGVSLLRWHASKKGVTIPVNGLGKAKTGVQMTAIVTLMLVPDPSAVWLDGLMIGVVAVTVASGLDYLLGYARRTGSPPVGTLPSTGA
jgi:CDP-diacylglycerol--glycerol-3-phosphate 3-phosphatidyltransferase